MNDDETIGRLLDFAGPRQDMSAQAMKRLEQVARPTWQAKVHAHAATRRRRTWLALAAMVVALAGAGLLLRFAGDLAEVLGLGGQRSVATVEALFVDSARTTRPAFQVGDEIAAGREIQTDNERAALLLATGFSVRLDVGTRLTMTSATDLELHQGAVYVDSGPGRNENSINIHTPYGIARDIGTQFEVRLLEESLRVQVREGKVEVQSEDRIHSALAGSVLTLQSDGAVERGITVRHGPEWDWATSTLPPFILEGRQIRHFLDWVCRERGLELTFTNRTAEERAAAIGHGSVPDLTPEDALKTVLPTAGLAFRIDGDRLVISPN